MRIIYKVDLAGLIIRVYRKVLKKSPNDIGKGQTCRRYLLCFLLTDEYRCLKRGNRFCVIVQVLEEEDGQILQNELVMREGWRVMAKRFVTILLVISVLVTCKIIHAGACSLTLRLTTEEGLGVPVPVIARLSFSNGEQLETLIPIGQSEASFPGVLCGAVTLAMGQHVEESQFHLDAWRSETIQLAPGIHRVVDWTIPKVGEVEVSVEDRLGHPIEFGSLHAMPISSAEGGAMNSYSSAISTDGRVRFWLKQGRYQVDYSSLSGAAGYGEIISASVNGLQVEIPIIIDVADDPIAMTIVALEPTVLHGRIVDSEGNGIGMARITGLSPNPDNRRIGSTQSSENGEFDFSVKSLPVRLVPSHSKRNLEFEPSSILVESNEHGEVLFLARESDQMLRGQIVDARSGHPVIGAGVSVRPDCTMVRLKPEDQPAKRPFHASADEAGYFTARCPTVCPFEISASSKDHLQRMVRFPAGKCDNDLVLQLQRGTVITGTVFDLKDQAVQDLPLKLGNKVSRTDAEGKYRFVGVGIGEYRISIVSRLADARHEGLALMHVRQEVPDQIGPVLVPVLENGEQIDVDLRAVPGGSLCISTTDEQGKTVPLRTIMVYPKDGGLPLAERSESLSEERQDPGRLCLDGVLPGKRLVYATGLNFVPAWWPGEMERRFAEVVSIKANKHTEVGKMVVQRAGSVKLLVGESQNNYLKHPSIQLCRIIEGSAEQLRIEEQASEVVVERKADLWEQHPSDWFVPAKRKKSVRADGEDQAIFGVLRFVPIGQWNVRICDASTECKDPEAIWQTVEPVRVVEGEESKALLQRTENARSGEAHANQDVSAKPAY